MNDLLIAISQGLRQAFREYDCLGRIAGNRFAVMLPGMKPASMVAILDRIHQVAAEAGISLWKRPVDLKLGGAFYPEDGDGAKHLLSVAERKLERSSQRWEASLRALVRATPTAESGEIVPGVRQDLKVTAPLANRRNHVVPDRDART